MHLQSLTNAALMTDGELHPLADGVSLLLFTMLAILGGLKISQALTLCHTYN